MTERGIQIFRYSLRFQTSVFLIISLLLLLMAFRYLLLVQDGFVGAIVLIAPIMFFFYGFAKYWRVKISKALFFEDHFELYGRGLRENLRYEDVQSAEITGQMSFWQPLPHLKI